MGMDPFLAKAFHESEHKPKANIDILRGLTVRQMDFLPESIDKIWQTAAKDFPPQVKYLGWKPCTVLEEYNNEPRPKRGSGRETDVAPNNIYMNEYRLGFVHPDGTIEKLPPTYLFLPYVGDGGMLWLSGAQWSISPMLGDQVLSFEKDRVFCQLSRAKFHIENVNHPIHIDGRVAEFNVPWSVLYNISSSKESIKITLLHYVLATKGLKRTLNHVVPMLGEIRLFETMGEAEEAMKAVPRTEWVAVEGSKLKTKPFYGGSNIVAVIDKAKWESAPLWTRTVIASLFFTLDRFSPGGSEYWGSEMKADPRWSEDVSRWRLLMGLVLWERTKNPGIIMDDINKHMASLDRYIDDLVRPRAARIGFTGNNLYDFFEMIIKEWEDWRLNGYKKSAPIYDKELNALYQVNNKIMQAIFHFYFNLVNEADKGNLTPDNIKKLLKKFIRTRMIYSIRIDSNRYVAPIAYSSDNMFCKPTAIVVPQRGNSAGGEGQGAAATRLHASISEVTSPLNLTKKDSTGLTRLNPFVMLDGLMYVIRNPDIAPITDRVQAILDKDMRESTVEDDLDIDELSRISRDSDE